MAGHASLGGVEVRGFLKPQRRDADEWSQSTVGEAGNRIGFDENGRDISKSGFQHHRARQIPAHAHNHVGLKFPQEDRGFDQRARQHKQVAQLFPAANPHQTRRSNRAQRKARGRNQPRLQPAAGPQKLNDAAGARRVSSFLVLPAPTQLFGHGQRRENVSSCATCRHQDAWGWRGSVRR